MTGPTVTRTVHFHRQAKGRKRLRDKAVEPVIVGGRRIPREVQLLALAITFEDMIRTGEARSYAEIARRKGVSRARITQIMKRVTQQPDEQEDLPGAAPPTTDPFRSAKAPADQGRLPPNRIRRAAMPTRVDLLPNQRADNG